MTQVVSSSAQQASRRPVDAFGHRRDELAESAMRTLGELGYARTTLREIAARSGCSHGVLHYYFPDKIDLIAHCVRLYKGRSIVRYERIAEQAVTAEGLVEEFITSMADILCDETGAQRLWYDLRLESLFEPSFRDDVAAIDGALRDVVWRIVERYAVLSGRRVAVDAEAAYAIIDGVFLQLLLQQAAGVEGLEWVLAERIRLLMPRLLAAVD
ncbi:TetR/AcrR family transcriptional regulator [Nakamurella lactea]|uniref:TetR/AcrR family transcriptional regulator n=1 Tax=Nakamurella lactea TaxID=459515 RepID=UPI000422E36E|nr:TetR/AcrR family transcriptional regulator [Nakamurella lactea]